MTAQKVVQYKDALGALTRTHRPLKVGTWSTISCVKAATPGRNFMGPASPAASDKWHVTTDF